MGKEWGGGDLLIVDGINLSNDFNKVDEVGGGFEPLDFTGLDVLAHERLAGIRDGLINGTSYLNPSLGKSHLTLSTLPTADRVVTYGRGTTLAAPAANLVGKQMNYNGERGDDGSMLFEVETLANSYGLEWCDQLTAGVDNMTGSGAGTGVDFNVVYGTAVGTTAFGLQAYLHVLAFTGTSATVAIQDSDDDGTDPYVNVTGAVFAAANAVGSQRIQTSRTQSVKRWLRINVTGTFANLDLMVSVVKNRVSTAF